MAENLRRSPQTKQELLLSDIYTAVLSSGGGDATEATLLLVETNTASIPTLLSSVSTTGSGLILPGSKAASIFIDGPGGSINGVIRPDGWSQSFEFHNDTLPRIDYNGNGTATMYVDILT